MILLKNPLPNINCPQCITNSEIRKSVINVTSDRKEKQDKKEDTRRHEGTWLKLTLGFLRQVKLHLQVPLVKIIQKTGKKRQEKMQASKLIEEDTDTCGDMMN